MAKDPNFAAFARAAGAVITTANTNRDGTGTLGTVLLAPAASGTLAGGSRIDRVSITAIGTTTDGMVRLFIDTGAAVFLYKEIEVSAIVPSSVLPCFRAEIETKDLVLPAGASLKASTHNAESFSVIAFGGDF